MPAGLSQASMKIQIKYLQNLFYDLLNDYGRVFIIVKYSDKTVIGNRGFTDGEKEKGLILVFNNKNYKTLKWTEDGGIIAALGFGVSNRAEKCFIHHDDIVAVFSPDAKVRFDRWDMRNVKDSVDESQKHREPEKEEMPDEKIVSLKNFRKTKT
ncbi:MAG: hypothetical protein FJ241_01275 [Nitrospira sp.]|nr:hypothetical protein [Nitrospira sp.]